MTLVLAVAIGGMTFGSLSAWLLMRSHNSDLQTQLRVLRRQLETVESHHAVSSARLVESETDVNNARLLVDRSKQEIIQLSETVSTALQRRAGTKTKEQSHRAAVVSVDLRDHTQAARPKAAVPNLDDYWAALEHS